MNEKLATLLGMAALWYQESPYYNPDYLVPAGETKPKTTDYIDKGAITAPYKKKDKLTRKERKRSNKR